MDLKIGPLRRLSTKELMLLNCAVGEDSWESPWTARRSKQSILKEISPGFYLEGLMLKLKLQYLGHLMRRADSFEKTLMLGGIEGRRRRGWQRMRWLGWHHLLNGREFEWTPGVDDGHGGLACCNSWGCKESDMIEWLNWTENYKWDNYITQKTRVKTNCMWIKESSLKVVLPLVLFSN